MNKPDLVNKARELTNACRQFHSRINCEVLEITKDYGEVLGKPSQTTNIPTPSKISVIIVIPSDLPNEETPPIKQLVKQVNSFDYVDRVFLEFSQSQ